jgi:molybdopterin converting factor small subunit
MLESKSTAFYPSGVNDAVGTEDTELLCNEVGDSLTSLEKKLVSR